MENQLLQELMETSMEEISMDMEDTDGARLAVMKRTKEEYGTGQIDGVIMVMATTIMATATTKTIMAIMVDMAGILEKKVNGKTSIATNLLMHSQMKMVLQKTPEMIHQLQNHKQRNQKPAISYQKYQKRKPQTAPRRLIILFHLNLRNLSLSKDNRQIFGIK